MTRLGPKLYLHGGGLESPVFQKFDSVLVLSLWRVSAWGHGRPAEDRQEMDTNTEIQRTPERCFTINKNRLPTISPIMYGNSREVWLEEQRIRFCLQPFVATDKLR